MLEGGAACSSQLPRTEIISVSLKRPFLVIRKGNKLRKVGASRGGTCHSPNNTHATDAETKPP